MKKKWPTFVLLLTALFCFIIIGKLTTAKDISKKEVGFYQKLASGDQIDYLIVGDSIGRGSGASSNQAWFNQLESKLSKKYGSSFHRTSVVQSGATAFEGIVKLDETVLPKQNDAVFIVFGENDRKYMNAEQFSSLYENLIRKIKRIYPKAEIFTMTESCLTNEDFANQILIVSKYYNAVNIDMRVPFQKSNLPVKQLTVDLIHPNNSGYSLYANTLFKTIESGVTNKKAISVFLPDPLVASAELDYQLEKKIFNQKDFQLKQGHYVSIREESFIEYEFAGSSVGIQVVRSPEGGIMDVYVDGEYHSSLSTWWPFERIRNLYVASNLNEGPHLIKFVNSGKVSSHHKGTNPEIKISALIVPSLQ